MQEVRPTSGKNQSPSGCSEARREFRHTIRGFCHLVGSDRITWPGLEAGHACGSSRIMRSASKSRLQLWVLFCLFAVDEAQRESLIDLCRLAYPECPFCEFDRTLKSISIQSMCEIRPPDKFITGARLGSAITGIVANEPEWRVWKPVEPSSICHNRGGGEDILGLCGQKEE